MTIKIVNTLTPWMDARDIPVGDYFTAEATSQDHLFLKVAHDHILQISGSVVRVFDSSGMRFRNCKKAGVSITFSEDMNSIAVPFFPQTSLGKGVAFLGVRKNRPGLYLKLPGEGALCLSDKVLVGDCSDITVCAFVNLEFRIGDPDE
jgi:hypothetical protein